MLLGGSVAIGGEAGFFCMLASGVVVTLIRNSIVMMHARRVCAAYSESIRAADGAGMTAMPASSERVHERRGPISGDRAASSIARIRSGRRPARACLLRLLRQRHAAHARRRSFADRQMSAFGLVFAAILLRPRFHRLAVLALPIVVSLCIGMLLSFNFHAGIEELVRFLFPIAITVAIFPYRDRLDVLVKTFIGVVASNDLFQLYFYVSYATGLPLFMPVRIDSGLFLRAQGWMGFFRSSASSILCIPVVPLPFSQFVQVEMGVGIPAVLAARISFKMIAAIILYPVFLGWRIFESGRCRFSRCWSEFCFS
ncbi:putative membrane protein [Burkholderia cepacia]|nr:putative membrane protein [Burkholderia cepacia]